MVASSKKEALYVCRGGVQEAKSLLCCVKICLSQIEIGV
ncbi:hypothetical protein PDIG_21600 [Penicillium digitatum PHI26]|uniref:Uncharacterized protein n=2 Tax=Penicillium digitatum TaxID=36651 RepID=K9GSW0_PEND2|nr:hypothetical protein PDIP_23880 [Penicillium digitatum Pd1]EKV16181.1 hypothetical protein PDIG_21600 [Penicillium digitatum PHI26]EKV19378.1 hypothetical protein PDIP_23880 [Penicillium digitatum Pd1]